ncbi:uncharacterized protein [Triticum aestivum]|uniref:uncharacterized protein n=1 Tax=Triticum aestivum TaxID=4565 RepID=UPI001D01A9AF|nr:uncharacterized protein LOC123160735 [Triticum aestivum]
MPLHMEEEYNFPCAVLSDEAAASSIQSLRLSSCAFHPTSSLGHLRRLTCLHLSLVRITEEGLLLLLSKCSVLERLEISHCSGIICLRVASTMQQLKYISVSYCTKLQVVQIDAPNLCSFHCVGFLTEISVTNSSQLKNVDLLGALSDARARLPSIIGNVESLTLRSSYLENVNFPIPMLPSKFPHLKNMEIALRCEARAFPKSHDIFSLVYFLDACPILDSFILRVEEGAIRPDAPPQPRMASACQ